MKYKTREGVVYDLESISFEESELVTWLREEYSRSRSWIVFHSKTAHATIEAAKRFSPEAWQDHPIYKIQLDLMANKGVEQGELRGELSRMFED